MLSGFKPYSLEPSHLIVHFFRRLIEMEQEVAMRICLIVGLIVATLYVGSEPANARGKGAWCARTNTGAGRIQENCGFNSVEACRRWITGGNRGFCSRNPAYQKRQSSER